MYCQYVCCTLDRHFTPGSGDEEGEEEPGKGKSKHAKGKKVCAIFLTSILQMSCSYTLMGALHKLLKMFHQSTLTIMIWNLR